MPSHIQPESGYDASPPLISRSACYLPLTHSLSPGPSCKRPPSIIVIIVNCPLCYRLTISLLITQCTSPIILVLTLICRLLFFLRLIVIASPQSSGVHLPPLRSVLDPTDNYNYIILSVFSCTYGVLWYKYVRISWLFLFGRCPCNGLSRLSLSLESRLSPMTCLG